MKAKRKRKNFEWSTLELCVTCSSNSKAGGNETNESKLNMYLHSLLLPTFREQPLNSQKHIDYGN